METIKVQRFELIILADESLTEKQVKELVENVQTLAGRYVRLTSHDMGNQRLSYPITIYGKEHETTRRLEFEIVMPAEETNALYHGMMALGHDERVVRYLLVKVGRA